MSAHHYHEHAGHGHDHFHGGSRHLSGGNERRIALAAGLTGLFMLAEVAGGLISGSLALLADAGHMLTDFAALALGYLAFRLSRRPRDRKRSYGYARFEVLVAFVNGLALFVIAGFILIEAYRRLQSPAEILAGTMLSIAVLGLLVNLAVFFMLHGADQHNLNIRGALLHVIGDLLGSAAAITAAVVILATGWTPIDPILSALVAVLILVSALRLVRDAGHVLLEGTPLDLAVAEVGPHLVAHVDGVREIHHLHAWSITPERTMVTLHACIDEAVDPVIATQAIKTELKQKFGIGHATVEVERGTCADEGLGEEYPCGAPHRHGSAPDPSIPREARQEFTH